MRSSFTSAAVAVVGLLASSASAELPPIVIKGTKFFYENGTQFFMKGIAYQQDVSTGGVLSGDGTYRDPLADIESCRRDVPLLQELNTNTIRVYAIDPEKNHDECMKLLDEAGIYVILDLSQPGQSVNRENPMWNDDLYERYTTVIDRMHGYTNLMGFFAGNEVTNAKNNTEASAFVKAAVRDSKAYIRDMGYRTIGVGYATNDDADIRQHLADYFNCDTVEDSVDFWGYNIYSWCGESTLEESGFDIRTQEFDTYSVPVFFAEYGCIEVQPRPFTEVEAIYGDELTEVWSGGIVYMYFQEANDYGLVEVQPDGDVKLLADFTALSSQMAKVTPSPTQMEDYEPTDTNLQECPDVGPNWKAVATPLPPTPSRQLCVCMVESLSCALRDSVEEEDYDELFSTVCGMDDEVCLGLQANATTGTYGAYSMCNPQEKLSFAFNRYYVSQNSNPSACDFDGAATTKRPVTPEGECRDLIDEAGADGTGTITSTASRPNRSETSEAAAGMVTVPTLDTGVLSLGLYVVCAALSGAAMIML